MQSFKDCGLGLKVEGLVASTMPAQTPVWVRFRVFGFWVLGFWVEDLVASTITAQIPVRCRI